MSEAFRCDRCGALQHGQPVIQVGTHNPDTDGGHIHIDSPSPNLGLKKTAVSIRDGDLCEGCAEAFREFWGEDA